MAATRSLSASLQQLGRTASAGDLAGLSDAELLGRFAGRRDEAAFAALVRRHGAVVLGVCRRVLRHEQDAEDAFQATFVVLARRAGSVGRAGAVGNWLYGVALNVARHAKAARHRRGVKEREAARRQPAEAHDPAPDDLREVIDAELHALPRRYRAAVVLCDLMGLTTREAAAEVGCPPKTLGTRLSRGRTALARRLARRGVGVPAAGVAAAVGPAAAAAVPPGLVGSAVRAATGSASPAVAALTHGVSNAMLPKALKLAAVLTGGLVALAGIAHAPALYGTPAGTARPARAGAPAGPRSAAPAPAPDHREHIHWLIHHLLELVGFDPTQPVSAAAPADDKAKPSLSGTWARGGDGLDLKLEFSDKDVLTITASHGDKGVVLTCKYAVEKDGTVKAKITAVEEKGIDVKDKLPVGTAFGFKWKVKGDAATLDDLTGDNAGPLKSHLEGEYAAKK